jgi:hypothetical protein
MLSLLERALPVAIAEEDGILPGIIALSMAVHARIERRHEDALVHLENVYQAHFAHGYQWGTASARYYKGETLRDLGAVDDAAEAYREALERYASRTDGWGLGATISGAAMLAVARDQPELAVRFFGAASTWLKRVGAFLPPTELAVYDAAKARLRGLLGEDAYAIAWQEGQAIEIEASVAEVGDYLAGFSQPPVPDAAPAITPGAQAAYDQLTPRQREAATLYAREPNVRKVADAMHIQESSARDLLEQVVKRWELTGLKSITPKVWELGFP